MALLESLGTVSYSHYIVTTNYGRMFSHFGDIQCKKNGLTLKYGLEVTQGH